MNEFYTHADTATSHTTGRSANVNTVGQAVETAFDKLPSQSSLDGDYVTYVTDTGAADVYVVSLPQTITAYVEGLFIPVKITTTNTGASTINADAVGAVAIKRHDGTDLQANDLVAGRIYDLRHDGTNLVLMNAADSILDNATAQATAAADSAAAALADKILADADVVLTAADVVTTGNNVTAAQVAQAAAEAAAAGIKWKTSGKAATTANITLSGAQTIDAISLVAGDICLVKNQTATEENGLYVVATGAWARHTDMDAWSKVPSAAAAVEQGAANADTTFICTADQGGTLETTAITWATFGTGDMKNSENLSGLASAATSLSNIGGIGALLADTTPQQGGALDTNSFAINESEGGAVASATTTDIFGGDDGNTLHITGTTTIVDFTNAAIFGRWRTIIFDGILTLTHGSGITLPGSANITTAVGDYARVYADAVDAFTVLYFRADGKPIASAGKLVNHTVSDILGGSGLTSSVDQAANDTGFTSSMGAAYTPTVTHTPASTSNFLKVSMSCNGSTTGVDSNGSSTFKIALFYNAVTPAVRVWYMMVNGKNEKGSQHFFHFFQAPIATSMEFKLRVAAYTSSGTWSFNAENSAAFDWGGLPQYQWLVEEFEP